MKTDKSSTSLSIQQISPTEFIIVTYTHDDKGKVTKIEKTEPQQFYSTVYAFKQLAANLWRPE